MAPGTLQRRWTTVYRPERRTASLYGEEYMVVGVTTTERTNAIELTPDTWAEGGAPKRSWASPWYTLTLKHTTITDRLGQLTPDATDRIARQLTRLIGVTPS